LRLETWKDVAELVGIAALVASIVFLAVQVQQSRTIAIAETNTAGMANWQDRFFAINEHSDIWVRGAAGEDLNTADAAVFNNLVRTYGTGYFMDWYRLKSLGQDAGADLLRYDFVAFLYENPGARTIYESQHEKTQYFRQMLGGEEILSTDWDEQIRSDLLKLDGDH